MSPRSLRLFIVCLATPVVALGFLHNGSRFTENILFVVENLMPPGTTHINIYHSMEDEVNSDTLSQILPALEKLSPVSLGNHHISRQFAFIFTDSLLYLLETLDAIDQARNEVRGSLLIYFGLPLADDTFRDIFAFCLHSQILDVHLIADVWNGLDLLTYFPYTPKDCFWFEPQVVCVNHEDEFRSIDGGKCILNSKKLSNFYGCPLGVNVFLGPPFLFYQSSTLTGLEADILEVISEKLNFTFIVLQHNVTNIARFQLFQEHVADISLGRLRTTSFQQANVTSSFTYCHSKMVLVIHSGRSLLSLERILIPADPTVWLIMFLFTAAAFCVFRALKYTAPSFRNLVLGADNRYPAYWSWVIIYGGGTELKPRGLSARLFLVYWILFHFVLRSGYQSFVYSSIRLDWKLSTPNTFMGVLRSGYTLRASAETYRSLVHIRYLPHIIRTYEYSDMEALHELEQQSDSRVAILVPEEVYRYHLSTSWHSNLTVVGKPLLEQMISMHFLEQSYLKKPFDSVLGRMQVSGLLTHWLEAYLRTPSRRQDDVNAPKVLQLADVKGHFQIYAALLAVSCGTLFLELLSLRVPVLRRIFFS